MNYFVHVMLSEIGHILQRVWPQLYRIPAPVGTVFDPENPLEVDFLDHMQRSNLYRAIRDLEDELLTSLTRVKAQDVTGLAAVEDQMVFLFNAHSFIIQNVSPCRLVQAAVFQHFCYHYNGVVEERFRLFVDNPDPTLGLSPARCKQYKVAGVLATQALEKQNPGVARYSTAEEPFLGTCITERFLNSVDIFKICSVDAAEKTCPICKGSPADYFTAKKHTFQWAQLGHNRQPTQIEQLEVLACLAAERYSLVAETEAIEVD